MFQFSKMSSSARLAVVALSFAGLAMALGLPLFAAAHREIPEVIPVVGLTRDDAQQLSPPEPEAHDEPEASEPEVPTPETSESSEPSASMSADEIKAAVQALLDAKEKEGSGGAASASEPEPETSKPEPETPGPEPETSKPEPETPGPEPETSEPEPETPGPEPETSAADAQARQEAEQAAQQQAEQAARQEAEQAAQQQAEQQAAEEAAAQPQSTPFPFNRADYSNDKGGYFDKRDGSRTIVAAEFPTGNYVSASEGEHTWMGEMHRAIVYVAENGMVVYEVIFF